MGLGRIDEIKRKITVLDYARGVLGLPVRKSGDRCCSLSGGANATALVIRDDFFFDFKLGQGGDVIDLCAIARHDGDRGAAIRELAGDSSSAEWKAYTQNLCNAVAKWHSQMTDTQFKYLRRRKIYKETADKLRIGFDGARLVIPYYKNGYVAYYVTRELDGTGPKYKKAKLDGLNENIPWGLDTLLFNSQADTRPPSADTSTCPEGRLAHKHIVITEGVFDAISFYQEGYRVLSPMGGHFNRDALKQVIGICQNETEPVFLCFDSDEAGSRFQMQMAKTLFKHKVNFLCGELPGGVKDISDYYADNGDLQRLIDTAQNGLELMCERITDKDEFKKFVFDVARFVEKSDLVGLFDLVSFPKAWLTEVKKQALAPPPEDMIVKEVIAKKRLKYSEALGFYEYAHGVWEQRYDTEIIGYIADSYGHYRTGSRVSAVLKLLKSEVVSTELFNQKPIFNFKNGTLELETGVFREHRESDLSSIQVAYDYEKEAYSSPWMQFIEDVCEGDDRKMCLLQEIAGYVLFSDNSMQKCFFLMGEGSNGKSVFLDVLSSVYGEQNVTTIEMSSLMEPFQRIYLASSLLNISSETKSDVRGSESIFKQIVVGDAINGCHKGKDFLTFRPRAKLIASFNRYIKSNDSSTGFMRRIVFISFNARFEVEPKQGERRADINLPQKLKGELPAIFNWAYAGYKILRDCKRFTETDDHREMMSAFVKITNPLTVFIEEAELKGRVFKKELYARYREWCREAGHEPMSNTRFTQDVRHTLRQMQIDFNESIYVGSRCFVFSEVSNCNLKCIPF